MTRALLILDLPAAVVPRAAALLPRGSWREAPALADAALASLLTAVPAERHGVVASVELTPDGQSLRAAPRHRLMQPPIWERLAGAMAVGLPWSIGSRGAGVVSAEFVRHESPLPAAPLPDRAWPDHLCPRLAALRLGLDELEPVALAGLGFAADTPQAQAGMAALLSLHAIATELLEQHRPPLLIVRFQFDVEPERPAATARFVEAMLARYRQLQAGAPLQVLLRHHHRDTVACTVHDTVAGPMLHTALELGRELAAQFGLPAMETPLPARHWDTVRARHHPPERSMPGMAAGIAALGARVEEALAALGV